MGKSIKLKDNIYLDTISIHRDIISAGLSSTKTNINTETITVNFDMCVQIGKKLTLENGKVKIGKNVKKVLVSGTAFIDTPKASDYLWLFIAKNGGYVASNLTAGGMVYKSSSIAPRLIEVKEGDLISMIINTTAGLPYSIRGGYPINMTVQVVE